eukprot:Gregarina_sp_Poly_1__1890@NODE_1492_length_4004_cov_60_929388_g988_i0_p1_GENE_NODE_1492_length_4004_cov_60_929388_g988_i0NODE_1492_length_4004_cov_60_929388_g988_i0_p1_ORF_typecomplete_len756_score113_08Na_H_Exchanger/PF00999_21/2_4e08NrfD_2/PF14589_6/0_18_NODE_1492_length_4004_cov_60_929388_g988_i03332600
MILARFLMVGIFYPIIRRSLGEFTWKEYLLLAWGGLRGAVCLILAFLIEQDDKINADLTASAALYIASSAFLVLFVNGITFEFLYKMLIPYAPNPFRKVYLDKVTRLVEREYIREFPYLHQHWLFEKCNVLALADRLVPQLNYVAIDSQGRISLKTSDVKKTLENMITMRDLTGLWGDLAIGKHIKEAAMSQENSSARDSVSVSSSSSSSSTDWRLQVKRSLKAGVVSRGKSDVAAIQHLRVREGQKSVNWKEALDLVEGTEETIEEDKQLLDDREAILMHGGLDKSETATPPTNFVMRHRVLSDLQENAHFRSRRFVSDFPALSGIPDSVTIPIPERRSLYRPSGIVSPPEAPVSVVDQDTRRVTFQQGSVASSGSGAIRRIPGYRYDAVVHRRSEPHGGSLDVAALERVQKILEARGLDDALQPGIPRARTEPRMGEKDVHPLYSMAATPPNIKARDRDGEILIMIVNTMRQLYYNMYEQSFISGKVYSQLLSVGDVVIDYALLDVEKRNKAKVWRSVMVHDPILDAGRIRLGRLTSKDCGIKMSDKERLEWLLENFTGFDVEWNLVANLLRGGPETLSYKCRAFFDKIFCRLPHFRELRTPKHPPPPETRSRWILRKILISSWSWLGTRSTFRTLDDLQLICAFVDVHSELLSRGDETLRQIVGPKMIESFEQKVKIGKELVTKEFPLRYPDSFPFALVCHAAIFLLNFKTQLVEEQYEKGLLMVADKEKICEILKKQLYKVARYHPPFLFS